MHRYKSGPCQMIFVCVIKSVVPRTHKLGFNLEVHGYKQSETVSSLEIQILWGACFPRKLSRRY